MIDIQALSERGIWIGVNREQFDLLEWTSPFGSPRPTRPDGPLVDYLKPLTRTEARPRSLSALHGHGAFPLHTDAAHHRVPPRITVLRLAHGSRNHRKTFLLDSNQAFAHDLTANLRGGIWLVRSGRHRFYRSALEPIRRSRYRLRYDRGCMTPVTPRANAAESQMRTAASNPHLQSVVWVNGMTLVFDNWRILHGRDGSNEPGEDWTLERILLDPLPGLLP